MNERKWKSLSEADRAAIERVSGEHIARSFGKKWNDAEDAAIKTVAAAGIKTVHVTGEELEKLKRDTEFLQSDWVKAAEKAGIDGNAALEFYRQQIEELKATAGASH